MNLVSGMSGCRTFTVRPVAAAFGGLLLLAGCGGMRETPAAAPLPPVTAAPRDGLGQFLGGAAQGQSGRVVLADGGMAQMQVVRSYAAASGRECREVLVGAGRSSLYCRSEQGWTTTRPLLLGSGAARP